MLRPTLLATALLSLAATTQAAQPLQLKLYNADAGSFHANSVLITGSSEAMVIDAGFTRADAYRIAAHVLDSGKTLKTILISNADPDYYFGAATLKNLFPQADIVASPAVAEKIKAKQAAKLAYWGPKMGANAPLQPVLPQPLSSTTLLLDGATIELRGTQGVLAHRPYVWIPSLRTIAGNVAVFSKLHVWTADTQQESERKAWLSQLAEMQALQPAVVIPGHMATGGALDASAIQYTRDYLLRFDAASQQAKTSDELIAAMQRAYPEAGLGIALDIGAKVRMGDMKW
ncbi:MAG: MBL fold metallo-hydrolase [Chitinimonas sp.]|nr:MBL fold metallo-hydrolase [Chitinimonas sp.]